MARARNIKPAFFLNTDLSEVPALGRLAFIGLWTLADYKGCIECNFKKIKAQVLPYDECNLEELLNALEQFRFIRYYFVQGKRYIKIENFERHQNPHKNEREAGSDIPDIGQKDNENNDLTQDGTKPDFIGTTRADSLNLIPDSPLLNPDSLNPDVTAAEKSASSETEIQEACRETWKLYATAYFDRYKTEPVRNAKVNGQVKQFVKRLGFTESPFVAAFYVQSNTAYYVQRGHSFDGLLADAEKLRTEWATGNTMTQTRARQIDKHDANRSAVGEAMKILEARNAIPN
jgi:hypothetical protein